MERRSLRLRILLCFFLLMAGSQSAVRASAPTVYEVDSSSPIDIETQVRRIASTCIACTIHFTAGTYTLRYGIVVTNPQIRLAGSGAVLTGGPGITTMLQLFGTGDSVEGIEFSTNGSTYGVIATGARQSVLNNRFHGPAGIYVGIHGSSGGRVSNNHFDGSAGCASSNAINVLDTANFEVTDNTGTDLCGFPVETIASNHGTILRNHFTSTLHRQTLVAKAGQIVFRFTWSGLAFPVTRAWVQVNGTPTSLAMPNGSLLYTSATTTTAAFRSGLPAGTSVTMLTWSSLEPIQINSMSDDITVAANTIDGTGDSGIDIVSDFHQVLRGSATATEGQSVFTIATNGTFTASPALVIHHRAITPNKATCVRSQSTFICTTVTPQAAGTVVSIVDLTPTAGVSQQDDYPSDITVATNVIKQAAAACVAPEVSAVDISITGNVCENAGMGTDAASYATGVFTGGASPILIKDNIFKNTLTPPTMLSAISVQNTIDTGALKKPVTLMGNVFSGVFPQGQIIIPGLAPRQAGIDLRDRQARAYPEQPDLNQPWSGALPETKYFSYSTNQAGAIRDTSTVMGRGASVKVAGGVNLDIHLKDQAFFDNSILRVFFWARWRSGTPFVRIYSNLPQRNAASPVTLDVSAEVLDPDWKQYSLYVSMQDVLKYGEVFIRLDGATGSMNVEDISISATSINGPRNQSHARE